jgi:zinc protease
VPPGSCSLRLIVHAGSREEQDDERGIAHFVEHMAFNGTRRFPGSSIVEWFQQKGMAFGRDVNAHTGFQATTYEIDLPHTDAAALNEGLEVLADFALGLLFEPDEVAREQGVIDAEERERSSPEAAAREEWQHRLAAGCRAAERSPIGVRADRAQFTAAMLRAFHARWYRPDNMTLVAVGDFGDVDVVDAARASLGAIPVPAAPLPARPDLGRPKRVDQCFRVVQSEREQVDYRVQCSRLLPPHPQDLATIATVARLTVACEMADWWLQWKAKDPASPVRGVGVRVASNWSGCGAWVEGLTTDFTCAPERRADALAWVARALAEVRAHGFTQELFVAVQTHLLALSEGFDSDVANASARAMADKLVERLTDGEVPTTGATTNRLMQATARRLDVESCRAAFEEAWTWPLSITSVEPEGPVVDAREVWDAALRAGSADVAGGTTAAGMHAGEDDRAAEPEGWPYATNADDAAVPAERSHDARLDIDDVRFANGVRVLLKRTAFAAGDVQLAACLGDGMRQIRAAELGIFDVHDGAFGELGLANVSPGRLRQWCATYHTKVSWRVESDRFELAAMTKRASLQFTCEMLAAHCRCPGWRADALDEAARQFTGRDERARHSFARMRQAFGRRLAGERDVTSEAELRAVTIEGVRAAVEPLLTGAPLTVVIVGDFDVDEAIGAVGRTLGRLAARTPRSEGGDWRRHAIATGVDEEQVVDTAAAKSDVTFLVGLPAKDMIHDPAARLLPLVLNDRLRIRLREQLGEAYAPAVSWGEVQGEATTSCVVGNVQCATGHERAVLDACVREVVAVGTGDITDEEFERARALLLAKMEGDRRSNAGWLELLAEAHVRVDALDLVATAPARLRGLSAGEVRAAAKRLVRADAMSTLILRPKTAR